MKKVCYLAAAGLFACSLLSAGANPTITEDFTSNPLQDGWRTFGNTNLFVWDATNQDLEVTWNSTNENSYFYRPLGTTLSRSDSFSASFDLQFGDDAGSLEIGIGFIGLATATNSDFIRGTGYNSPNLAEFDYFPDYDSIDATTSDTNSSLYFKYADLPLETGVTYHIELTHAPGDPALNGMISTNGVPYTALPNVYPNSFTDFRLDAFAISCYSTNGDPYGDYLLAHGTVGRITLTLPPPPVQNFAAGFNAPGKWRCSFTGRPNWNYALERSTNLMDWTTITNGAAGPDDASAFYDPNPPADKAFYRVRANLP
jgi:hypothetical protein